MREACLEIIAEISYENRYYYIVDNGDVYTNLNIWPTVKYQKYREKRNYRKITDQKVIDAVLEKFAKESV